MMQDAEDNRKLPLSVKTRHQSFSDKEGNAYQTKDKGF